MAQTMTLDVKAKKQAILELIKVKGPCLPASIAETIKLPLLLTSALLSELKAEQALETSALKVGGSPLYYLKGQEQGLEAWISCLPKKEQEAFQLLKEHLLLDAEQLEPAHRVALANLKDFAIPIKVKFENKEKFYWRFYTLSKEEAAARIEQLLKKEKKLERQPLELPKPSKLEEKKEKEKPKEEPKRKKPKANNLKEEMRRWLELNNFKLVKELDEGFIASTLIAKAPMYFLVLAKEKARLGEADLSLAYQRGLIHRMPVLLLIKGKLTKAAQAIAQQLSCLLVRQL